ncbi:hypothetical protein [Rhizobium leucaenae]|uniref:hypothetical protein n=1 Tax=Rhizobium leucaenae TaxID=29450 RepID=UPI0009EE6C61|nr:hypothetical protein [Rhizobium leucaenae]MBB6303506.1 hypothetical protein [Rhizobium leucaenae]
MSRDYVDIENWNSLTEAEAVDAAIKKYGKDGATSVSWCTLEAWFDRGPEYTFWFNLLQKLANQEPGGRA